MIEIDAGDVTLDHSHNVAIAFSLDYSQCFDPFARERLLTSARQRRNSHLVSKPRRFANSSFVVVGCSKPSGALCSTMARNMLPPFEKKQFTVSCVLHRLATGCVEVVTDTNRLAGFGWRAPWQQCQNHRLDRSLGGLFG